MKHLFYLWSVILLFRAGFIHMGYHTKNLKSRFQYAWIHTKRSIAIGAADYNKRHADIAIREFKRNQKRKR